MNEARKVGRGKSKGVARLITTATRMWRRRMGRRRKRSGSGRSGNARQVASSATTFGT